MFPKPLEFHCIANLHRVLAYLSPSILLLCAISALLVKKDPLCFFPLGFCEFMEANKNAGMWAEQKEKPGGAVAGINNEWRYLRDCFLGRR